MMSSKSCDIPYLPLELILEIVQALCWTSHDAIFPQSHEVTKTLIALTQVSQGVYPVASALLYQHCAHIDTKERLLSLCRSLSRISADSTTPTKPITKLFLSPYPRQENPNYPVALPAPIYPFALESPLNDLPTSTAVHDLLLMVAPTLRSLVIDMPLRSLYPPDDFEGVRPLLRAAFCALVGLERFVSVRDELFLSTTEARDELPVWAEYWPKIQYLALYNLDLGPSSTWLHLSQLPCLRSVMLVRADGYGEEPDTELDNQWNSLMGINIKDEWLKAQKKTKRHEVGTHSRDVTLIFADRPQYQPNFRKYRCSWQTLDPDNNIRILLADVPGPDHLSLGSIHQLEVCPIESAQQFLCARAVDGTLWDEDATWIRDGF